MRRLLPSLLLGVLAVGLAGLLPSGVQAQWGRSMYGHSGYYGRGFGSSYYTYPYSSGYSYSPGYSSYYFNPGHNYYSPGFSAFALGASGLYTGPVYTGSYYSGPGYGFPFRTYPLYSGLGYRNFSYAPGTIFVYP